MNGKILVDTNVLVYAYDRSEPEKQQQALQVLEHLGITGRGVVSVQILAEFFVVVTRKLNAPLTVQQAYNSLKNYLEAWTVLDMTGMVVLEAARGVRDHQFSYWDAQIWAAARLNQIAIVLSEDFNVGATVEGVRFANPFAVDFLLSDWVR